MKLHYEGRLLATQTPYNGKVYTHKLMMNQLDHQFHDFLITLNW